MSHNSQGDFDLAQIKKILEQDGSKYFKGVGNTDVDWFLRDSNVGMRSEGVSLLDKDRDDSADANSTPGAPATGKVPSADNRVNSNSSTGTANGSSPSIPPAGRSKSTSDAKTATPSSERRSSNASSILKLSPAPLHLQTTISNTNDHTLLKTKPSVAAIQEENVSDTYSRTGRSRSTSNPPVRRRQSASSLASNNSANGGGGFFSKLKGKFHKIEENSTRKALSPSPGPAARTSSSPSTAAVASVAAAAVAGAHPAYAHHSASPSGIFKDNYQLDGASRNNTSIERTPPVSNSAAFNQPDGFHLTRTMSTPATSSALSSDPRLEEYIQFYKQKDMKRKSSISRRSSISSAGPTLLDKRDSSEDSRKGSFLIPSHPKYSPLPSALTNGYENVSYGKNSATSTGPVLSLPPSKLTSFLKRRPSVQVLNLSGATAPNGDRTNDSISSKSEYEEDFDQKPVLPEFAGLRPLKRVAFHSLTFLIDPPQQIPSRKPRKGNVEILPTGQLKIHSLSEEEKAAVEKSQMGQGGGIIVGGTGALGLVKSSDDASSVDSNSSITPDEGPDIGENGKVDEETRINSHAKLIEIDKPMFHHHNKTGYSVPVKKMALDMMYTRCCHLREILPIPAILKQIPAGSMAPIPLLQLRNPTPTMIEIQTFADFVRIAPIVCISLDGVSLSFSQLKVMLSAMAAKTQLEKLSLRNTSIDHEGWSLLCWFLSRNTVMNKLDITQCPSLSVNLLKKKKRKAGDKANPHEQDLERMTCNKENRSDMDWELFTATLVARGGIEELILTGCCITDTNTFENLIKLAALIKTSRLGLAYNNLSVSQVQVVVENWLFKPFVRGIDFGYNDFSSSQYLNAILKMRRDPKFEEAIKNSQLAFFSLNATNLRFNETFKEYFETLLLLLPNLKYLDLSNNLRLFGNPKIESKESTDNNSKTQEKAPTIRSTDSTASSSNSELRTNEILTQDSIVSYITSKLPLFPKLIRLHLENNNFSADSIISIAQTLPFCKNLGYFSIHGNDMDVTAAAALVNALENSKTIIALDFDLDNLPGIFKERIGLLTMRNMEWLLYSAKKNNMPEDKANGRDDENSSSSQPTITLTEQLNAILSKKANHKLDLNDPEVKALIVRAKKIRQDLRTSMDELFKLQLKNELTFDGKEMLIKFVFIESSIERGLQLIDPSLVEPKQSFSSDFLRNSSAEDQRNTWKMQKDEDNERKGSNINQSITPVNMSRTSSKSNLTSMDKNEGSVLKLRKIHDDLESRDVIKRAGSAEFFEHLQDLSGEEIREKLLDTDLVDLDKIIGYLEELKHKNISLEKVFNQKENERKGMSRETNLGAKLNELQKTLGELAALRDDTDASKSSNPETTSTSKPSSSTDVANADTRPEEEIPAEDLKDVMEAYDHVLHDLERRINN